MFDPIGTESHRDIHQGDGRRVREGFYTYLLELKRQADAGLRTERDPHLLAQWQGAGQLIDRLLEAIKTRP